MTHLLTSYYANVSKFPKNAILIQISSSKPNAFRVHGNFKEVAPSYVDLAAPHKQGQISDSFYRAKYLSQLYKNKEQILQKLDRLVSIANGSPVIFLCWCKPDKFCHRHIFAEFVNQYYQNCLVCEL